MTLCIPRVVGPLNEMMASVRVQGAVPGATIVVSAVGDNPRELGMGVAVGGDDRVQLVQQLSVGDLVTAVQVGGGDSSPPAPAHLMVPVGPEPASVADLGFVGSRTHLYTCGQAVWVTGALPGATVEISWNGTVHGAGIADPDGARIQLDQGLPSTPVTIRQTAPVGAGPLTVLQPDRVPHGADGRLPAPKVNPPLIECQSAVLVSGVLDGTKVTLTSPQGRVDPESAFFDLPGLWMGVTPLSLGVTLTARQTFPGCKLASGESVPPVKVGPASGVPKPRIVNQLCQGAVSVTVSDLVPGSLVKLNVPGTTYTGMAPSGSTCFDFFVAPLNAGTITATQEMCGVTSTTASDLVTADR